MAPHQPSAPAVQITIGLVMAPVSAVAQVEPTATDRGTVNRVTPVVPLAMALVHMSVPLAPVFTWLSQMHVWIHALEEPTMMEWAIVRFAITDA